MIVKKGMQVMLLAESKTLLVPVTVLAAMNGAHALVTPVGGQGQLWVHADRLYPRTATFPLA